MTVFKKKKPSAASVAPDPIASAASATAAASDPRKADSAKRAESEKESNEETEHRLAGSRPIDPNAFYVQAVHRAQRVAIVAAQQQLIAQQHAQAVAAAAAAPTAATTPVPASAGEAVPSIPVYRLVGTALTHKFGTPIVLSLIPGSTKGRIRELVWQSVKRWLPENQHSQFEAAPPYTIRVLENMCIRCGLCQLDGCAGCELVGSSDEVSGLSAAHALLVCWSNDEWVPALEQNMSDERVQRHASSLVKEPSEADISLYDCIKQYTQKEVLGKDDAWYSTPPRNAA